jgi:hypothetical protein
MTNEAEIQKLLVDVTRALTFGGFSTKERNELIDIQDRYVAA